MSISYSFLFRWDKFITMTRPNKKQYFERSEIQPGMSYGFIPMNNGDFQPRSREERVKDEIAEALSNLTPEAERLIEKLYGLNGTSPQSSEEVSRDLGIPITDLRQMQTEALRALRGYGSASEDETTLTEEEVPVAR
jgi:DNA-directed RNA polymerase sigma subunit (sigma70/sigma32)